MKLSYDKPVTPLKIQQRLLAGLAGVVLFVLAFVFSGFCLVRQAPAPTPSPSPSATPSPTLPPATPTPLPTATPVPTARPLSGAQAADVSTVRFSVSDSYLRHPFIYNGSVVFVGGSGTLDQPIMRTLYLGNLADGSASILARCSMTNAEIFEPQLSATWAVWLEYDGTYYDLRTYNRLTRATDSLMTGSGMLPRIALAGDRLAVHLPSASSGQATLTLFDLITGQATPTCSYNTPAMLLTRPGSDGEQLVYAAPLEQTDSQGNPLVTLVVRRFGYADWQLQPGMYAHAPVVSGDTVAFLNDTVSQSAGLYAMRRGDTQPTFIDLDVAGYAVCDGYVIYSRNQNIYAYDLQQGQLLQLATQARLPAAGGGCAMWYEWKTTGKNSLQYCTLPTVQGE